MDVRQTARRLPICLLITHTHTHIRLSIDIYEIEMRMSQRWGMRDSFRVGYLKFYNGSRCSSFGIRSYSFVGVLHIVLRWTSERSDSFDSQKTMKIFREENEDERDEGRRGPLSCSRAVCRSECCSFCPEDRKKRRRADFSALRFLSILVCAARKLRRPWTSFLPLLKTWKQRQPLQKTRWCTFMCIYICMCYKDSLQFIVQWLLTSRESPRDVSPGIAAFLALFNPSFPRPRAPWTLFALIIYSPW